MTAHDTKIENHHGDAEEECGNNRFPATRIADARGAAPEFPDGLAHDAIPGGTTGTRAPPSSTPQRQPPLHERAQPPPRPSRHPVPLNHESLQVLTTDFPFLHPRHIDQQLAGTLVSLATDLDRIRERQGPTTAELRSAPLIYDWRSTVMPMGLRLIGTVRHHPRLGDRLLMTSPIWAADPGGKWVRTLSRFYRLGRPLRHSAQAQGPDACDFEGGL